MLGRSVLLVALASLWLGCGAAPASAPSPAPTPVPLVFQTIVEVTRANVQTGPGTPQQSVTVPDGPFNNIRFSWIVVPGYTPTPGSLYILTQLYEGRISGLKSTTAGLLARSIRVEEGEYVFDASVTLQAGTKYWFAADGETLYLSSQVTSDLYEGGDLYSAGQTEFDGSFSRLFVTSPDNRIDANFRLRGVRVR